MKMLLIILAVMTFTVKDKSTVTLSGVCPANTVAEYTCSYQKGSVRSGDEAVLNLSSLGGIKVKKISISIKSNNSGGGGKISVSANGTTVASKSGTFKTWTGAYDGANYHSISLLNKQVAEVENLVIRVKGTENSLHIEKYVIEYQPQPPHTVRLMNGLAEWGTLTESESGAGILLPTVQDTADWHFIGWSDTHFWTVYTRPDVKNPNTIFYPSDDLILWAVYSYQPAKEQVYLSDLQSGEYMYVHSEFDYALTGVPNEGRMSYAMADEKDSRQYYWIDLVAPDTAYITHSETGAPIGHSGTSLAIKESPWLVAHSGYATTFYTLVKGKTYVLWFPMYNSTETEKYAGLHLAEPVNSPLRLQIPCVIQPAYTCHPETGVGIREVHEQPQDEGTVIRFGIYELHIKDGKKEIRL